MRSIHRRLMLAAATATLVAACGGGGSGSGAGEEGSGGQPPATGQPPVGASKTVIVTGAITGFGSVIVNGVRYDTTGAEVRIDDRLGTVAELRVGQVVRMEAEVDDRGQARARRIEENHLLQGAVQSVDLATGTITVAGQRVRVDDDTSFDDSIASGDLAGLSVGERVEIHGFPDARGEARATRIERDEAGEIEIEVTGRVVALEAASKRFTVGSLIVDYSAAVLEDFGAAGIAAGDLVEVKGREFLSGGVLSASRVHREDHGTEAPSGGEAEYEGFVTRFASAGDFDVDGRRAAATATTAYVGGTAADLGPDIKVEVEGRLDDSGVLVAARIVFRRPASVRLEAPVEAVDVSAGTLRALGLTIVVDAMTRREDHEQDDHFFALDDLRIGDWVEVAGYPDPAGSDRMIATRLERDEPEDQVELRGQAESLAAPRFEILGVAIETTPETEFEDEESDISAETFFASAAGRIVDVEGRWDGTTLVADEAEIEHEPGTVVPPSPPPPPPSGDNRAPLANAGSPSTVTVGTSVTLDARGSSDPDGDALAFSWTLAIPSGSAAALVSPDSSTPSFTADVAGTYTATVEVSDGQLSSTASVTVTAQAAPPSLDGAALYASNCALCHGQITAITRMPVSNRNVTDIRRAIDSNRGGMGFLSSLTDAELQAIVDAMRAANP